MKVQRASLDTYRKKPEAISGEEITLKNGVVVAIREWGCPQFFDAVQEGGFDENTPKLTQDRQAIDRAMAHWVIAHIWDGDTKIDDPKAIHEIITDPLMWEFRLEIMDEAAKGNRWHVNGAAIKNSQTSSSMKKSGDENIQETESIGHA